MKPLILTLIVVGILLGGVVQGQRQAYICPPMFVWYAEVREAHGIEEGEAFDIAEWDPQFEGILITERGLEVLYAPDGPMVVIGRNAGGPIPLERRQ